MYRSFTCFVGFVVASSLGPFSRSESLPIVPDGPCRLEAWGKSYTLSPEQIDEARELARYLIETQGLEPFDFPRNTARIPEPTHRLLFFSKAADLGSSSPVLTIVYWDAYKAVQVEGRSRHWVKEILELRIMGLVADAIGQKYRTDDAGGVSGPDPSN